MLPVPGTHPALCPLPPSLLPSFPPSLPLSLSPSLPQACVRSCASTTSTRSTAWASPTTIASVSPPRCSSRLHFRQPRLHLPPFASCLHFCRQSSAACYAGVSAIYGGGADSHVRVRARVRQDAAECGFRSYLIEDCARAVPVSYTHLTLPTICSV
eukprot:3512539-Rhodomonas_salina.1